MRFWGLAISVATKKKLCKLEKLNALSKAKPQPASHGEEVRDSKPSIQILSRAVQAFPDSKEDTSTGDAFAGQRKLLKHVVMKLRL